MKPTTIVNGNETEAHKLRWGTAEKAVTAALGVVGSLICYGAISTAQTSRDNNVMLQRIISETKADHDNLERVVTAVETHVNWASGRSSTVDAIEQRVARIERALDLATPKQLDPKR